MPLWAFDKWRYIQEAVQRQKFDTSRKEITAKARDIHSACTVREQEEAATTKQIQQEKVEAVKKEVKDKKLDMKGE